MSDDDDTGMAVEAPGAVLSTGSNPTTAAEDAAHVPHVVATTNGNGKRAGSVGLEEQEVEAKKKAKLDAAAAPSKAAVPSGKKRSKVIASSDEDDDDEEMPLAAKIASAPVKEHVKSELNNQGAEHGNGVAESSSEDDKPLAKKVTGARPSSSRGSKPKVSYAEDDDDDDSEDDVPLAKKTKKQPAATAAGRRASAAASSAASSDDDDVPLAKKTKAKKTTAAGAAANSSRSAKAPAAATAASKRKQPAVKKEASSSEDEKPLAKRAKGAKVASAASATKVKNESKPDVKPAAKTKKEQKEQEELYAWWEEQNDANGGAEGDGTVRWRTLWHNGVLFPPDYVPLPPDVKMRYDGQPLTLEPEAEEVAGFFAALLETDHAKDAKFRENFFRDWRKVLERQPPSPRVDITDLDKCDFRPMWEYMERQKEIKKSLPNDEKKRLKAEKDEAEKDYLYCVVDGRKEKIGNFRLEPPGLFRGRGEHPKKGTYKHRLKPEDVIINIGEGEKVPEPNMPGQWKEVRHDPTVTWLAHWKENVNGNSKYVFLSAGSTWKGQSDREKFEKARKLQQYVDRIRKDYNQELNSKVMAERQRATAMYLIDRLALRAGNEKGEDEADTVGCCSLRLEHVTLLPPSSIELRFLGKDSIMYEQTVEVEPQVFKNIKIFKRAPKSDEDDLFDRLTTTSLNKHLSGYMDGLTAKVFRTYNASFTFQQQLDAGTPTSSRATVAEKIAAYNRANKEVAILCNHQKTVSKGHATSMEKLGDKLMALKYQRMKLRHQLFALDSKLKKKKKELAEDESDLDDDAIERHESLAREQARDKARKKFERENVKLESEGGKPLKPKELEQRLKEVEAEHDAIAKETRKARKSSNAAASEVKGSLTVEKVLAAIGKLDDRIGAFKVSMEDRESNKTVALGTSKINYIDPRLTVAWAKRHNVPLEKLFSKTLITKFPWAVAEVEANPEWRF